MMHRNFVSILAAGAMLAVWAGATPQTEWEAAMCVHRPHLSAKETRSPRTRAAASLAKNGGLPLDEIAGRTLGTAYVRSSEWDKVFQSDEESVDVCTLSMDGSAEGRFAVYGQLGNYAPYYWIAEGLDAGPGCTVAEFLEKQCLAGGNSSMFAVDGLLSADDVDVFMREESVIVPYGKFHFAFIDDLPGANWEHPCRYVFVAEDFSGFTVLYKNWMPSLVRKGTQERVPLVRLGDAAEVRHETLEEVKNRVYGYARGLVANGISYTAGDRSRSYFVLVSGGDCPEANGIRFWCDTAMFYSTLTRKYGIAKDHIYVYVSDGNQTGKDANLDSSDSPVLVDSPKDLDGDGVRDVTGAANKDSLKRCFSNLEKTLTAEDQLLVFMTSHGGPDGVSGSANHDCVISLFNSSLRDDELADMTKGFPCPVAVAVECCYAGGFIDDICATSNRAVATACNHYEVSWGYGGGGEWIDDTEGKTYACNAWMGPLNAAFRGFWPKPCEWGGYPWEDDSAAYPDSNGDGVVSFAEAAAFAIENDRADEHPQYESTNGAGDAFFILNGRPYETQEKSVSLRCSGSMMGDCSVRGRGGAWRLREAAPSWIKSCSLTDANGRVSALTHDATVEMSGTLSLGIAAYENTSTEEGRSCVIEIYNETFGRIECAISVSQDVYRPTYVVTFNPGANGTGEVQATEQDTGLSLVLPGAIFTRTGCSQTGWSAVDGGDKLYDLAAIYTDSAPITLYPYWSANTYTIKFDRQGGSGGPSSIAAQFGSSLPAITVPARSGYVFAGYFSAADGLGKMYYTEDGEGAVPWDVESGMTLYAKWSPEAYGLEFDLQGGTGVTGVIAYYGCPMQQIEVPLRPGYVFCGYFSAKSGGGSQYYNADGTSARAWNKTKSATLYASWKPAVYSVTLDMQGGTGETDSVNATYGSAMPGIVPPVRPGFLFLGYYAVADDSGEMFYDMSGKSVRAWSNPGEGVLYAHWMACGFSCSEIATSEGSAVEVRVVGGDAKTDYSLNMWLAYNSAAAADLNLANGTIDGDTPKGGLKFPLTLSWAAGEIGERVVTIPIKADKAVEDDEFFTLQLVAPVGMELGEERLCTVTIHDPGCDELAAKIADGTATKTEQTAWDKLQKAKAPYIRGLADTAERGKVTGSGPCAAGKKVTLKATANKGFVFVGWTDSPIAVEGDRLRPNAVEYIATTPSLVIDRTSRPAQDTATATVLTNVAEDATFYACFITAAQDKESITAGLDGGAIPQPNVDEPVALVTNVMAGVALRWPVASEALSATTIKVAGLPAGLKFTAKDIVDSKTKQVTVPANTIYGAPTAASKTDKNGVVKPSDVKITVTTAGKSTVTYLVQLTVDPLPAWAVGTFDGPVSYDGGIAQAFTVAANGKISGKVLEGGKTWALSAASFDTVDGRLSNVGNSEVEAPVFLATVIGKAGKEAVTNEVAVTSVAIDGEDVGVAMSDDWTAYQNLWKRADTKAEMPVFKANIVVDCLFGEAGDANNTVKVTFKKDGAVAFAGKIGGASVSGSSQLVKTDGGWQVTLYAPPKPTAKPPFEGWCETFDVTLSFGDANVVTDVSLE